ncbi:MAG: mechanosensitive ion channel [Lentimicrobium sp.]|jgi:small-conductance mechanosensitive channel|nr:mechanosensitive ion channel [Lentimicrobium sp.]
MDLKSILDYQLLNIGKIDINLAEVLLVAIFCIVTLLVLKIIWKFFSRRISTGKIDRGSAIAIYSIIKYILWIIFILTALNTFGVNLNLMLAGSAALLVGIGFGIQQIFNDLVSGIIILMEGNLKVGDVIQFENELIGKVTSVGLRTSKIRTRDDIAMIVPNSKFINDRVINWSHNIGSTRFMVSVGVAYGTDVDLVTRIMLECTNGIPEIEQSPEPFVRFIDFGDSSLDFQLFFWLMDSFRNEHVKSKLRYAINRKFKENNITIPFPQRDVHFHTPLQNQQI